MTDDVAISNLATVAEPELPSLLDLADEPSTGNWEGVGFGPNKNWYPATVLAGYATKNGTQWQTEDTASKDGSSRNLRICYEVVNNKGEKRNTFESYNYRLEDLTAERIAAVKAAREMYKGTKGKWPNSDIQRSSLALASIGGLERAFGFRLKRTDAGWLDTSIFVGQKCDVRLGTETTERGTYNVVAEIAKAGERTAKK
jgi:hypothetical protein